MPSIYTRVGPLVYVEKLITQQTFGIYVLINCRSRLLIRKLIAHTRSHAYGQVHSEIIVSMLHVMYGIRLDNLVNRKTTCSLATTSRE